MIVKWFPSAVEEEVDILLRHDHFYSVGRVVGNAWLRQVLILFSGGNIIKIQRSTHTIFVMCCCVICNPAPRGSFGKCKLKLGITDQHAGLIDGVTVVPGICSRPFTSQ